MMPKSKDRRLPSPTYMSENQIAQYLEDLRTNRHTRLNGSRPPPPSRYTTMKRNTTDVAEHVVAREGRPQLLASTSMPAMASTRPNSAVSHTRAESTGVGVVSFLGRPLVQEPSPVATDTAAACPTEQRPGMVRTPSLIYRERERRWMEKQEARSIRMAMEDMDLEEDRKLHSAAQDEAADLVWKHQNPDAPFDNPDVKRDYRGHLRKGSYQRMHSQETAVQSSTRKISEGSRRLSMNDVPTIKRPSIENSQPDAACIASQKTGTPSGKSYGGLVEAVAIDIANARRRTSSGSKRILSGEKKLFMHPDDHIFEDPTEEATPPKKQLDASTSAVTTERPAYVRKNPFSRVRMAQEKLERSNSAPVLGVAPRLDRIEIQRNPPTQVKKPWYMSNESLPPTPPKPRRGSEEEPSKPQTPTKEGIEVRGDDIRSATTMRRKDRSPKLPQPTIVSDKPGRPIVSFQPDWKPKEIVLEEVHTGPLKSDTIEPLKIVKAIDTPPRPAPPRYQACSILDMHTDEAPKPPIPTICLPDEEPMIPRVVLPEEPDFSCTSNIQSAPVTPAINISGPDDFFAKPAVPNQRALPVPSRPLPRHAVTSPLPGIARKHITASIRQSSALCAHCALPIAGRILSAAGERFHPGCFTCHDCATNLECVAFYPEPEQKRAERVARIRARQSEHDMHIPDGFSAEDMARLELADGDEALRFYCHLDFHELFSPRCKSCETPIEGEVILALGHHFHAGHFFCAQCGDPFDSRTPFVEKDGYAWCVNCHTNRYSSKCRKCRKPVTDVVVKALGYDWHGKCFCCMECSGEFEDGRYFLRGESQDPVCVRCEEKRLKA